MKYDGMYPSNMALRDVNKRQSRRIWPGLGLRQLMPRLDRRDFPHMLARTNSHHRKHLAQGIVELLNEGDRRRALRDGKWR